MISPGCSYEFHFAYVQWKKYSACYTTTTYKVNTFKNRNKRNHQETFLCIIFSFISVYLWLKFFFTIEAPAYDKAHDQLTNHSKVCIGSGRKQPPVFNNKSCFKNFAIFTGKCICWSLFLIKNFKATLLKRGSNTGVFLRILWNF